MVDAQHAVHRAAARPEVRQPRGVWQRRRSRSTCRSKPSRATRSAGMPDPGLLQIVDWNLPLDAARPRPAGTGAVDWGETRHEVQRDDRTPHERSDEGQGGARLRRRILRARMGQRQGGGGAVCTRGRARVRRRQAPRGRRGNARHHRLRRRRVQRLRGRRLGGRPGRADDAGLPGAPRPHRRAAQQRRHRRDRRSGRDQRGELGSRDRRQPDQRVPHLQVRAAAHAGAPPRSSTSPRWRPAAGSASRTWPTARPRRR
jgi:hypothetical protein